MSDRNTLGRWRLSSRRTFLRRSAAVASAAVIGTSATTGTAAADIGDGRVADYHLNNLGYDVDKGEKVQNLVHDASSYQNDGTAASKDDNTDGPDVVENGAVGNAYEFVRYDSDSYDYVEVPDDDSLDLTDELTLAAWVNTADAGSYSRVISREQVGQGNRQYNLGFDQSGQYARSILDINTDGSGNIDLTGTTDVADDTWHHIALTYDKGAKARLYVDGSEEAAQSTSQSLVSVDANIVLGAPSQLEDVASYDGLLDEARIYNRALSASEINDLVDMRDD